MRRYNKDRLVYHMHQLKSSKQKYETKRKIYVPIGNYA
jgi:hypothetical protein